MSLESSHTGVHIDSFVNVFVMLESPRHNCFLVGCSPAFMRLTPYGASRLVHAMPALSVKSRRAQSQHCAVGMRKSMIIRLRPCMTSVHLYLTHCHPPFAQHSRLPVPQACGLAFSISLSRPSNLDEGPMGSSSLPPRPSVHLLLRHAQA